MRSLASRRRNAGTLSFANCFNSGSLEDIEDVWGHATASEADLSTDFD